MSKKSNEKSNEKSDKSAAKNSSKTSVGKSAKAAVGKIASAKSRGTLAKGSQTSASKKTLAQKPSAPVAKPVVTKSAKKPAKVTKVMAKTSAPRAAPSATTATASKPKTAKLAGKTSVLAEGAPAPSFKLPRDGGAHVSLADYAGQKLVMFFYPRADTPGCTREAIDFTRLYGEFADAKTAVLGVSADPMKAQESFQKKHALSMPLMSDETHSMLASYGAWGEKSMYGKTFEGVLRTTVLIGKDGKVAKIWHGVKVDGHADEVLAAARDL